MRILLADDDSKIHLIVKMWLGKKGHEVATVNNGCEALSALQSGHYDILITDVNMPLKNGIELVREAMELTDSPPLMIIMTSRCDREDLAEKLDSNRVHLFNKPFSPADLANLVEQLATQQV